MKKVLVFMFVFILSAGTGHGETFRVYNRKGRSVFHPGFLKGHIASYLIEKSGGVAKDVLTLTNRQIIVLTNGVKLAVSSYVLRCRQDGYLLSYRYEYYGHSRLLLRFDPSITNDSYFLSYAYNQYSNILQFLALDTNAQKQVNAHTNLIKRRDLPISAVQGGFMSFPELFLYNSRMRAIHSLAGARKFLVGKALRVMSLNLPDKFSDKGREKEFIVSVREIKTDSIKINGKTKTVWRIKVGPSGLAETLLKIAGHDPTAVLWVDPQTKKLLQYAMDRYLFVKENW